MRRRSRADGEPLNTRRRKKVTLKRRNAPKAMRRGSSSAAIQMELRTSEERWRSLLDNPIFGVTFLDEHQRFITTNQTFRSMVGYSNDELRQMTPLDISVSGEREINEAFFKEMQQGQRQHYEMIKRLRCKDGKLIWINLYVFAITDRRSGARLTFGMVIDTTEKKQAQDALQETRAELARVARMNQMAAMTGSIVHEISQPIAAMVANANAGLRWVEQTTPDVNETRSTLKGIVRDGQRAAEVIKGIRAMFRADAESRVLVDLNELTREVLVLAQSELRNRSIEVHTELGGSLPPLMADRAQLQQVMFNLITNAIDAMDSMTDRTRILRVKSKLNGSEEVFVTVEDSGIGIAPGNVDRVFDTFFTIRFRG
jgi:PAS domain S-box-containing protein